MIVKLLVFRDIANEDIDAAATYYIETAGEQIALRFADALQTAYRKIADRPSTGSSVLAHHLNIDGLRTCKVGRFPYRVLYLERRDHIDIWRILRDSRDIGARLRDDR